MKFNYLSDDFETMVLNKVEEFKIPGQFYLLRNLMNDLLGISRILSPEAKILVLDILEIQVRTINLIEESDLHELLLSDLDIEIKRSKNLNY